ncbi:MAX gene-associated protein isoform X2 [Archocentrus centrarchus]|uniref:MAX gene-associated protein isoform X2 n=1 Tax=Archocentrus centrarchus TaxID=63155 RepID=UPI0011E9B6B1|nr:MAX gene-associated protein-like isoform X2 [Archocentrus centrarchus]
MSALDSELPPMEENQAVEGEKGSLLNVPFSAPPASIPSSAPPFPTLTSPNFTSETVVESKAVSMASNDCSAAVSSPAEASPAKSAVTSTSTLEGTVEKSPDTSHIESASDSLTCTETSVVNMPESSPWSSALPVTTFGSPDVEKDFPAVLTFKGVSVSLENNNVWKQFYSCGTEMILTKQGRRMFPYCRYRLAGLDPNQQYNLVLSIVPLGQYRYRWSASRWEVTGRAEHQNQGLIRAFSHHYSPCRGSDWMNSLVSFYKLKLTNNSQDQDGHIILHSMHRYIPRLHIIPVPDGGMPTNDNPVVMGHESMTFTFPQTEFMAVTTYQNFRITQLKINHNPFAKGFRQDGNNPRLNRIAREDQPMVKAEYQPLVLKPAEPSENQEEVVDLSANSHSPSASPSNVQETRLVLKPIMSNPASKDDPYVPCIRGKHALGELVLVEPKEESNATSAAPEVQEGLKVWLSPKARSVTPNSSTSTPVSSPRFRKRRKRINRRWANSRGREYKTAAAYSTVVHSPSLTVAMQPEMDDIEGLLFVSFASKQALEVHVRNKLVSTSSSASPASLTAPTPSKQTSNQHINPETDEEKIARFEAALLNDLRVLKHRQVIHPALQEVGLKLSSLDLSMSIDLQYLGICLPLPPPEHSKATAMSPGDEALPFISRTGKTSDMTKIKGWKNKFIKGKETSPSNCEGLQKNLSAFCSNMLDEYLESEAQRISERADAFSTNPEGFVSYQLPAKSSSYVKTLDSILKHQKPAHKFPPGVNRPCPLSHKPLLYSALTSPAPPLATPAVPCQEGAKSTYQSASSPKHPDDASGSSYTQNQGVSQRMSTDHLGVSQRPEMSFGQNQGMIHKPSGLTKFQHKLLEMEMEALNQGLSRTQLTSERLSAALSVILTKEMQPSQILKAAPFPKNNVVGPECGQEFCRLGCVCSSLQHLNRGHLHCRRPECMFGCTCFKRKITKQMSTGDSEEHPVYSMTNMEHVVQPRQGLHANKMWISNSTDEDPEAVFIPKSAPLFVVPPKVQKRSNLSRPAQPIREEDKDPVYKYLESMMTCARVREFNSKPPPQVTLEPKLFAVTAPATTAKRQKSTDSLSNKYYSTVPALNKGGKRKNPTENASQETASSEAGARKQIQIQSVCRWQMDQKMILEALCQRMNHDQLSQRFYIGPYCIRPVTKIVIRKPGSSIVTYQVQISKPSKASDCDEDECDDGDEEMHTSKSLDENTDAEEEDDQIEEPQMWFGVTPFLNGVIPAGMLRAEKKPVGCQASGLIQVNGKSYNQARLQLGKMGSLHPANRLAAYVTGRLHASVDITHKNSQKPDSMQKTGISRTGTIKAASSPAPPLITAKKTTGLKTPAQAPAHLFQPCLQRKGSISLLQHSQKSSNISSVQSLASSQHNSNISFQSSSSSSPVSLTVSQSLKVPSFLGQSGTYSFRICPPSNQGTGEQKLPGVTLPGGFTLIQLPKPRAGGAVQESGHLNAANKASAVDALLKKDGALNFSQLTTACVGVDAMNAVKSTSSSKLVEPGSSPELVCDEKMPSDETDEASGKTATKQEDPDVASEDTSSYSSDCEGEGDEDDETVDVETVEEEKQQMAIAKMKKAVFKALLESRDSSEDLRSLVALDSQDPDEHCESKYKRKRENHTVLERLRRSEQRDLFDKLQIVLHSDPRAPRLHLLSQALKEIQILVKTSKHLEETKEMLMQVQSGYVEKLSQLSGKPQNLIRHKLKSICERQKRKEKKMKSKPFFSELLQSRATLLQTAVPQPKATLSPLLPPDFVAPSHANVPITAAQNNLLKIISLLKPLPPKAPTESCVKSPIPTPTSDRPPLPVSSPVQVAAPRSQVTIEPGEHVLSDEESQSPSKLEVKQKVSEQPDQVPGSQVPNSQTDEQSQCSPVKASPQVPAAQEGASPVSPTANHTSTKVHTPQAVALPLIRSKTGRIILPSCLKPIGQGFYTLMVMKPNQKGEESDVSSSANMQPSDVDLLKKSDTNLSASDPPLDSETGNNLDSKTASSDSDSKGSNASYPLAELAILNKSIFVSSVDLKATENSCEGSKSAGLNTTLPAARLSFNPVHHIPPVGSETDPSHPIVCRARGRPRKNPASTPVGENEKCTVVEKTRNCVSEGEISMLLKKKQSKKNTLEETKMNAEDPTGKARKVGAKPVPGKRPRGRPPKRRSAPVKRPASSPLRSSPARLKCRSQSPAAKAKESPATTNILGDIRRSRPLTRGALGKDFPSAKKRSWIDVEKELEPDVEFA